MQPVSRLSQGPVRVNVCPPSDSNGAARVVEAPVVPGPRVGTPPPDSVLGDRLSLYSDVCADLFCRLQLERLDPETRCIVSVTLGTFKRLYADCESSLIERGRMDLLEF